MSQKIEKTDAQWQAELSPEQFRILRQKGTERAFTGAYYNEKQPGTYLCAGCGTALFSSETKYDSGSGWPSFWQPLEASAIAEHVDETYGMRRTEIVCSACGGHLGHVFPDGPKPSGLRYCINALALEKA